MAAAAEPYVGGPRDIKGGVRGAVWMYFLNAISYKVCLWILGVFGRRARLQAVVVLDREP